MKSLDPTLSDELSASLRAVQAPIGEPSEPSHRNLLAKILSCPIIMDLILVDIHGSDVGSHHQLARPQPLLVAETDFLDPFQPHFFNGHGAITTGILMNPGA